MSLDLLKEARAAIVAGVSAAESLFSRHGAAVTATNDAHAAVSVDLSTLKQGFSDLLTKVDAAIAELEGLAAKAPTMDDLKAFIARM